MAARLTKRADNRFTVTVTLDGKRRFFYGTTKPKAKAEEARARVKLGGPVRDATRPLAARGVDPDLPATEQPGRLHQDHA